MNERATLRDTNAIVESFIANQTKELEIRQRELETKSQELTQNHELAMKSMEFQAQDRRETRQMMLTGHEKNLRWHLWVGILAIIAIVALVYLGQAALAGDIAKIGGGLVAGYIAGNAKSKNKKQDETD